MVNIDMAGRQSLNNDQDLVTPTVDAQYELGTKVGILDQATKIMKIFMYIKSHTAIVANQPYAVVPGTETNNWVTAAPATNADKVTTVGVPLVTFTSGYYGFVQIEGPVEAKVAAETYTSGDYMEVLNGGTTFVVNGTSGATVFDAKSAAKIFETGTTATTRLMLLIGQQVVVAAS